MSFKLTDNIAAFLVIVICLLIQFVFFGRLMLHPNDLAITVGGDGLIIHYNMVYHLLYGDGLTLSSWNYPHFESIFLTDAQAALTLVLKFIQNYLFDVSEYVVGISNVFLLYSVPLTAYFLYRIFRELEVSQLFAIGGAVLLTYLSPQLIRIFCGHYGIGYNFLIPLYLLWIVRFLKDKHSLGLTIFVIFALLFFGFNNPYTLMISSFVFLSMGGVVFLFYRSVLPIKKAITLLGMGFLPLMLVYITIKLLDNIHDRVTLPWGFYHHVTKVKSLFLPQRGGLFESIKEIHPHNPGPWESQAYVGFAVVIGLFVTLFYLIKRKNTLDISNSSNRIIGIIGLGAIPILCFLFGTAVFKWLDIQSGPLTAIYQFRAPGRYGWIIYFLFGIIAVYGLYKMYDWQKAKRPVLMACMLLVISQIWIVDDAFYLKSFKKDLFSNPFKKEFLSKYKIENKNTEINKSDYLGIYSVPMQQGWTDKIVTNDYWNTQYHGILFSAANGLPHINGKLSRMSVAQTLDAVQLLSDPIVNKNFVENHGVDKKILIFEGVGANLTDNERVFIAKGKLVIEEKEKYKVHELRLGDLQEKASIVDSIATGLLFHDSGKENRDLTFCGDKATYLEGGKNTLVDLSLDTITNETELELSVWCHVDHIKFGAPKLTLRVFDVSGKETSKMQKEATRAQNTQDGWVRLSFDFKRAANTQRLSLSTEYQFPSNFDELQLRKKKSPSIVKDDCVLYNNFKID